LVTEDCILILNQGQEYALDFQWPATTETLCPFFQPGFVEQVAHSMTASTRKQLDDIEGPCHPVNFHERLYPRVGRVAVLLDELYRGIRSGCHDSGWLEDQFVGLAEAAVELSGTERKEAERIQAQRSATRSELHRRLHRGRDYLAACYSVTVTVAGAAKAAALSPYHFHRQFRSVFGETPMQFVQARRLEAARRMLLTTDLPVTQICLLVGFESLGSFSTLFRRRFGRSPREFRRQGKKQAN
jgi:AraC-like DNA-binding protein